MLEGGRGGEGLLEPMGGLSCGLLNTGLEGRGGGGGGAGGGGAVLFYSGENGVAAVVTHFMAIETICQ